MCAGLISNEIPIELGRYAWYGLLSMLGSLSTTDSNKFNLVQELYKIEFNMILRALTNLGDEFVIDPVRFIKKYSVSKRKSKRLRRVI